jgi:hypothetical protein
MILNLNKLGQVKHRCPNDRYPRKKSVHYTDIRFAFLQRNALKVFVFTVTTLADLNVANPCGMTNMQTIFAFCPRVLK